MKSLWWYPRAWRVRYGGELVALMEQYDADERSSLAARADIARAGLGERLRILAPGRLPPEEKAREGVLLVLYAWVVFVVGGVAVAKVSEHWQAVTPSSMQLVPARAFSVLYWTAGVASGMVIAGALIALPAVAGALRRGAWRDVRRPAVRSLLFSVLAISATVGLARWAHSLTPAERNGADAIYTAAFVGWFVLAVSCLFSWALTAAAIARRVTFSRFTLRLLTVVATAVGGAMAVMAVATGVWWASLARVAPWFFSGRPVGSSGSVIDPNMAVASALILTATILGLTGAVRSARAEAERS